MYHLPQLKDIGNIRYGGIFLWKQQDGSYSTLMFPEHAIPTQQTAVPERFKNVVAVSEAISAALSHLGGVRVTMARKTQQPEDGLGIVIDKNAGDVEQFNYAPFIPLSPTIGVVSHHLFMPALSHERLVVKSVVVNKIMNPLCAEDINQDLGEFCEAEVLDPSLILWSTQDEDPCKWETPNDFQFLKLQQPLFSEFFTPLPCFNLPYETFSAQVPEQLVSLGFAASPDTGIDNNHLELKHWLEYFPTDFHKRVPSEVEENHLKAHRVNDAMKVKQISALKDILTARVSFIEHVVAHKCVSIGEYSEHEYTDSTAPNFRARISLWPGLSGGPAIPICQDYLVNRQFIGLGSGSRVGHTVNAMVSVNNVAFANGYKLFVLPSFGPTFPSLAQQYIGQFKDLVNSLGEVDNAKRQRLAEDDDSEF